jgi:PDZ domain-containing protein
MRVKASAVLFLAACLIAGVNLLASRFYALSPGGGYEIESRLSVPPEQRREMGRLLFTAVAFHRADWKDVLAAQLGRPTELIPLERIRPHGMSSGEMRQINERLIDESKKVAALVALRAAGYEVGISGQGATVHATIPGAPAEGVLAPGDTIVAVDDQPIQTAIEAIEAIRRHRIGDEVRLTITRDGERRQVTLGTTASPEEPGRPAIGAAISTEAFDVQLPFPVEIDTENIGGASAGLMFALGILDSVTDGQLTKGHTIAGTGTISADGSVGPIGGAGLKVIAAENAGADTFFVPREDYEEARGRARTVTVVPVDRFADAVRYLCDLSPTAGTPPTPPAPCSAG